MNLSLTHPAYADAFELECLAMKKSRGEMSMTNVKLMFQFCCHILEGKKEIFHLALEGTKRDGSHPLVFGQALSDYPEITEYLLEIRIDSMNLSLDSVIATTRKVLELEKRLSNKPKSAEIIE